MRHQFRPNFLCDLSAYLVLHHKHSAVYVAIELLRILKGFKRLAVFRCGKKLKASRAKLCRQYDSI